jgi:hypothetical protein
MFGSFEVAGLAKAMNHVFYEIVKRIPAKKYLKTSFSIDI